ncbi:MAG: macro domain-containing protein [Nitrospirae bacterium]|nr:macro domain-containing protein [Nitrospirota bacterium]
MINFMMGDIFKSEAQTLVATVNCAGVMGKGLAKEFKQRFPEMFKEYAKACKRGELRKGTLFFYDYLHRKILCFPTKDNWKNSSKYEFIEEGLIALRDNYSTWGISSIAIPPLGSGLGGLRWDRVRRLIQKYLGDIPINIEVYEPLQNNDRISGNNPYRDKDKVKITAALIYTGEMIRIARNAFPIDNIKIGRLLLQKIAFFSQMAGLPIKLNFEKYKYGPYDHKLKFNVERLEGIFVRDASPTIARSDLRIIDEQDWTETVESSDVGIDLNKARKYIDRAVNFLKDESVSQIELLSTVYLAWVSLVAGGLVGTNNEVFEFIQEWKLDKFTIDDVEKALNRLYDGNWIPKDITEDAETLTELINLS